MKLADLPRRTVLLFSAPGHPDEENTGKLRRELERRERKRLHSRRWRAQNEQKGRDACRNWRVNNRARNIERCRQWREKNRDKTRAAALRYYARKREARIAASRTSCAV